MGGYNSGRYGGRPTAESSCKIDIAWMFRERLAVAGSDRTGALNWTRNGEPAGSIGYRADMRDPEKARLTLSFRIERDGVCMDVEQIIHLTYTRPKLGGRRWWMHCPFTGERVGKLYKPPGRDRFAGRKAWRLGYHSQRISTRFRPYEAMFRLQRKLGGEIGWGQPVSRPKGMHQCTYERHLEKLAELDRQCSWEAATVAQSLMAKR